jgi:hypothetical protein
VAESDELAVDASVAPGGVLSGHPQHQGTDGLQSGRPARLSSWVGPAAGDEVSVPVKQGPWRHEPQPAQLRGQKLAQRAEDCAVDPGQGWAWVVSAEHGDLVTEHQDLDVLGCVGSGEQRQPAQDAGEREICESKSHRERSSWQGSRVPSMRSAANVLVRSCDTVLGTHRRRSWLRLAATGRPRRGLLGHINPTPTRVADVVECVAMLLGPSRVSSDRDLDRCGSGENRSPHQRGRGSSG